MADREDFATAVGALIKGRTIPRSLGATDLNTLTTTQVRTATVSTETNAPNMPSIERSIIRVVGNGSTAIQQVEALQTRRSWWRTLYAGNWTAWAENLGGFAALSSGVDYNTLKATATVLNVAAAPLADSTNSPTTDRHVMRVTGLDYGGGLNYVTQEAVSLATGRTYTRALNISSWSAWRETASTSDIPDQSSTEAGQANALLVEDWSRRRGGRKRVQTGAVALRFDHGLANFNSKIRPLLEARNLPYSLALNSGDWDLAENAGVTAAMVDAWVQGGLCEVWNHSANHSGAVDIPGTVAEIVDGLADLRAQIPSAQIDGFVIPGTAGRGFGPGFVTGATVAEFYDSEGGRIILGSHAVSTGAVAGTGLRVLDGTPRQAQAHTTLDTLSLASAQTWVGLAESQKRGLQLMLHPSLVDTAGHITTATFEQILDHIVAERDAGRLAVLGPYDLMLADSTPSGADDDTDWHPLPTTHASTVRTGGTIELRRTGHRIRARFTAVTLTDGTGPGVVVHSAELPLGYTAPSDGTVATAGNATGNATLNYLRANGSWWWVKSEPTTAPSLDRAGISLSGEIEWFTDDPWPTTTP